MSYSSGTGIRMEHQKTPGTADSSSPYLNPCPTRAFALGHKPFHLRLASGDVFWHHKPPLKESFHWNIRIHDSEADTESTC